MKNEFKNLFKTKQGILIIASIAYAMVLPYLTIFTLKYPDFAQGYLDFGTLFLSFIPMLLGDIMAECFGWKKSLLISSVTYALQLFFLLVLYATASIPGACIGFGEVASEATFGYELLFSAQWRITIASACAYYFGIFFNSYIMGWMKDICTKNGTDSSFKLFFRCIFSTVIGQLLDNGLFFVLAMAPVGIDSSSELPWNLILGNILLATALEIVYEIILFPLTKKITKTVNNLED